MKKEIDTKVFTNGISATQLAVKPALDIRVHKERTALDDLYVEWESLAEKSKQTLCMSPDWVGSWWKHFGSDNKNRSLYIFTVYDEHKLVAIFPFYQGVTRIAGVTVERRLQLLGSGGSPNERFGFSDDYGISDFLDLIVDPEYNEEVAELFVSMLDSTELSSYHITFHQVRDDSFIKRYLYPRLEKWKGRVTLEHTDTCPYVDLTGVDSLQAFIKQSKSNARRRFRQTLRAEGIDNEYVIEAAKTPGEIEDMMESLIQLHQQRWNDIGFPGAFYDPRFRNYFEEVLFTACQNNRLWFKQAVDRAGVCASRMLLYYNGRYYDYMTGFDDNSPSVKSRPGIGLLLNLVEDAVTESTERVELLRGEESYKYDFAQQNIKNWRITIPVNRHRIPGNRLAVKIIYLCSFIYKYGSRELQLLKVQYDKVGWFKMLGGYFQFRAASIKLKIKS